jgi:hypothetical protein
MREWQAFVGPLLFLLPRASVNAAATARNKPVVAAVPERPGSVGGSVSPDQRERAAATHCFSAVGKRSIRKVKVASGTCESACR